MLALVEHVLPSGIWIRLIIGFVACSSYHFVDSRNLHGAPVKFVHTSFGARSVWGRRRWWTSSRKLPAALATVPARAAACQHRLDLVTSPASDIRRSGQRWGMAARWARGRLWQREQAGVALGSRVLGLDWGKISVTPEMGEIRWILVEFHSRFQEFSNFEAQISFRTPSK
jgi:hypothetical protein